MASPAVGTPLGRSSLERPLEARPFIGRSPAQACHVLQDARAFIGYQSGLNILADNFDSPQVMLYFNGLERLINSWPKSGNIANPSYRPFLLSQSPVTVAAQIMGKAPLLVPGSGPGDDRLHAINGKLGASRDIVIQEAKCFQIPHGLMKQ